MRHTVSAPTLNPIARAVARGPFYYGWAVSASVSLTVLAAMTYAVSTFSAFVEPLSREHGWSRTAISAAISFGTVGAAAAGPLFGRLTDRYGARWLFTLGTVSMGLGLLGMANMGSLFAFYVFYAMGRTMMMNFEHLVGPTVVANWFIARRATATALMLAASRVGLGLWPALAGVLIAVSGWRLAATVMGIAVLATAVVPLVLVVARRPEDVGMDPDGRSPAGGAPIEPEWSARAALRTQAFWALMLAAALGLFAGGGMGLHRIPFFTERGLSSVWVGPILMGFGAGMAVGGFVAARLHRHLGPRTVTGGFMVYGAAVMAVALITPPNGWAVVYGLADGAVFGGMFTLQPVIYAGFYGRRSVGTIRGLAHPALMLGNAAGALFGGVLYDATGGSYTLVFLTFSVLLVIAAGLVALARHPGASPTPEPAHG